MSWEQALKELEKRIGVTFQDRDLLRQAVTHPSVGQEKDYGGGNYQRLEFLGDAVLQLILTAELYRRHPEVKEGVLTKARARMVNRASLSRRAAGLALGEALILGKGEEEHGGRSRSSTLADAFEAVVGAIYLDRGMEEARRFVLRQFEQDLQTPAEERPADNPKGALQELLQAISPEGPEYRLESVSGPDHARFFECSVRHKGRELGRGFGRSKKAAEMEAALKAIQLLESEKKAFPNRGED
ncbi:MAG: ribonuclease III [Verrucomicrobia bacterium]|nr:ribonuclease III [Verrucomicrobiota bacterium]